jgi:predicted enzyme related to lactoylglutathione lyase
MMRDNDNKDNKIDYVEFQASNMAATKKFYGAAFGWKFVDYGAGIREF